MRDGVASVFFALMKTRSVGKLIVAKCGSTQAIGGTRPIQDLLLGEVIDC